MKKFIVSLLPLMLAGCAASTAMNDSESVGKRADLRHVCILDKANPVLQGYSEALQNSLKRKRITADIVTTKPDVKCQFVLRSGLKPHGSKFIKSVRIRLSERTAEGSYNQIGSLVYKQVRGDERKIVEQTGLQGQTDRIVAELFKNY